ncbi:DUF1003 domain-containing protein [Fructobacillus durionis]|uniref:Uncharacterized membrane protein n=1 Tax=Fructobacillus durionis TaxID=283737 RepID=A0A1I1EIY8_9LACO|nr:DUF1003 domain-containing protein [Fructobacillus durionis]SFB87064.1 Uncharacterized membrane protein [Fructobacillus durionis]
MANPTDNQYQCLIDNKDGYNFGAGTFLHDLDPQTRKMIKQDRPKASDQDFICSEHLVAYRLRKLDKMIHEDQRKNQQIHQKMQRVLQDDNYKIIDVGKKLDSTLTFGQKVADGVAHFGGSWPFVISFVVIMIVWIILNVTHLFGANFDPFPFILLNLFLSMVAAIQAPLIMMAQNRASDYDRMESQNDYHVNLKSEEEIRLLHAKVDHLIQQDQPNSMQIQKMQMEMLASINEELALLNKKNEKD